MRRCVHDPLGRHPDRPSTWFSFAGLPVAVVPLPDLVLALDALPGRWPTCPVVEAAVGVLLALGKD